MDLLLNAVQRLRHGILKLEVEFLVVVVGEVIHLVLLKEPKGDRVV